METTGDARKIDRCQEARFRNQLRKHRDIVDHLLTHPDDLAELRLLMALDRVKKEADQNVRFMLYAETLSTAPQATKDTVEGAMRSAVMGMVL